MNFKFTAFLSPSDSSGPAGITLPEPAYEGGMRDGADEWDVIGSDSEDENIGVDYGGNDETSLDGNPLDADRDLSGDMTEDAKKSSALSTSTEVPEQFKEYSFKGKVNGEPVEQAFKTKKDMDRTLANGLLAPKILEAYNGLKTEVSSLREDAQWGRDLQEFARTNPEGFLDHITEHLFPTEEALAAFVYKKFNYFRDLANLTPEQRQMKRQASLAEKLLQEKEHSEQLAREAGEKQQAALREQEVLQAKQWQDKEMNRWKAKIPEEFHEGLQSYFDAVYAYAYRQLDGNKPWTFKHMSEHLNRLLSPLAKIQSSPSQTKKEELANNKKANQRETNKLKSMAKTPPNATGKRSISEGFEDAKHAIHKRFGLV